MRKLIMLVVLTSMMGCSNNNEDHVSVYIDNGAIQCEYPGLSEKETAQNLKDSGIDVYKSRCGYITGIAIATQCGLGDNSINIHLIDKDKVIDAQNIGYEPVSKLESDEELGYEIIECQ